MAKRGKLSKSRSKDEDKRPIRWRKYPHLFLIVCEDGKTEPYYFDTFRASIPENTIFLRTVGTGTSTKGVVQHAINERDKLATEANKDVDEVWAVFDKDDAQKEPANTLRFQEAFSLAQEQGIQIAYSNEAFELWLLLHFNDVSSNIPIPRTDLNAQLQGAIAAHPTYTSFVYKHGDTAVIDVVIAIGNEGDAIVRAEGLLADQSGKLPIDANPSTKIQILVKQLRALIAYWSYVPD